MRRTKINIKKKMYREKETTAYRTTEIEKGEREEKRKQKKQKKKKKKKKRERERKGRRKGLPAPIFHIRCLLDYVPIKSDQFTLILTSRTSSQCLSKNT